MFYRPAILFPMTALVVLSIGASLYWYPRPQRAGLVVERPEQVLHDPQVGQTYKVHFRVLNHTRQVHRIVGAGFF
jgi:hypothetical protein